MAKQGQHKSDDRDQDKSRAHNPPKKGTPITTGTYQQRETYRKQAIERRETDPRPLLAKNEWHKHGDSAMNKFAKKDIVGDGDSNAACETREY